MFPQVTQRIIVLLWLGIFSVSCSAPGPEPLRYGEDVCDYCRMSIVEQNFGSELVTKKGKILKFDSIECLAAFTGTDKISAESIHSMWITDFTAPSNLVDVSDATFVHTSTLRSPMGVGLFGFSSLTEANEFIAKNQGNILAWTDMVELVKDRWGLES